MKAIEITSPDDPALAELCARLAEMAPELDRAPQWPAEQLQLCGEYGVYEWFIDPRWGGQGWNEEQVVRGYLALAAACLTTTFIITQRTGACRRIESSANEPLKQRLLPPLARGESTSGRWPSGRWPFATVGLSHLTTSRRHVARPVLTAEPIPGGFRLDGMSPWVTGGAAADVIVIGATVAGPSEAGPAEIGHSSDAPADEQLLIAVPTDLAGLAVPNPLPLVGLSASSTGPVHLDGLEISDEWLIAGPMRHVMASGAGAGTGGYETSTLAVGLAQAAIDFLAHEGERRADLGQALAALQSEHQRLRDDLLEVARGDSRTSKESVRQRANSLVLRSTQAALSAAKGSGYVVGHPAGRWCREALFFLVWSCPQPVAAANLCELAGIQD